MTRQYGGSGDPARTMALLWGTQQPTGRGPRPGLDVERIVRTAVGVAVADGLEAVSMRRIASELGVGPMSLYTYIPGKQELLDLMIDRTIGASVPETDDGDPGALPLEWRARLEALARAELAFYRAHPWVLQVSAIRSGLGPGEMKAYNHALGLVTGLGLTPHEMVNVVGVLSGFVRGVAESLRDTQLAPSLTGQTSNEWWYARVEHLTQHIQPGMFPALDAMDASGAFNPIHIDDDYLVATALDTFEFGLQRLLDGIGLLITERVAGRDTPAAAADTPATTT